MLLKRYQDTGETYQRIVTQDNEDLKLLRFGLITLQPGQSVTENTGDAEAVFVLLQGTVDVTVKGEAFACLTRRGVFLDKATAVYAPAGADYEVKNSGSNLVEVAVCKTPAPADGDFQPFVVSPEEIYSRKVGQDNWQREVHDIVVKNAEGRVHRIIVGETFNPPGNWSSYPPHKHDEYKPGEEACMEEVYHYRIDPDQGFGLQHRYAADGTVDETYAVRNRDTFLVPNAYHPVCAAAGYQLYYLWTMAGETDRIMIPNDDPTHAWIRQEK